MGVVPPASANMLAPVAVTVAPVESFVAMVKGPTNVPASPVAEGGVIAREGGSGDGSGAWTRTAFTIAATAGWSRSAGART